MREIVDKIDRMIRARYPIVVVQSHEEARVTQAILQIAQTNARPKSLYTWTISRGLRLEHQATKARKVEEAENTGDPIAALLCIAQQAEQVLAEKQAARDKEFDAPGTLYVLKDLHAYLGDPVVVRHLRDVAELLVQLNHTIVLLSPNFSVPPDLEKDVAVVDFPLPTDTELAEQLEAFVARLPDGVPCDLNGGREKIIRALQGLTAVEADACLAQAVIANGRLDLGAIPFILAEKAQIIRKAGALEYYPEQAAYAEIGGLDLLKGWCAQAESAYSEAARQYGIEPPKGLLLVGAPGCGKSLTAKAVAGGSRPLLRLDVGALFGSLVGQSEQQTRNALKVAEAVAPCVMWLDEIEKALGGSGGEMDGGTSTRVLGTILTWMQESKAPVFIVATANDIAALRPELIRRFDEVFFVDLPTQAERAEILAIHLSKRGRKPGDYDLGQVAAETPDFTGSELEKIVKGALRRAFADGQREMTTEDLLAVVAETVPLATTMAQGIAQMREWAKRARPASSGGQVKTQAKSGKARGKGSRAIEM